MRFLSHVRCVVTSSTDLRPAPVAQRNRSNPNSRVRVAEDTNYSHAHGVAAPVRNRPGAVVALLASAPLRHVSAGRNEPFRTIRTAEAITRAKRKKARAASARRKQDVLRK